MVLRGVNLLLIVYWLTFLFLPCLQDLIVVATITDHLAIYSDKALLNQFLCFAAACETSMSNIFGHHQFPQFFL